MQKQLQEEMENAREASVLISGTCAPRGEKTQSEIDATNDRLSIVIDEWCRFLEEFRGT